MFKHETPAGSNLGRGAVSCVLVNFGKHFAAGPGGLVAGAWANILWARIISVANHQLPNARAELPLRPGLGRTKSWPAGRANLQHEKTMSIATKTGDEGATALMYKRRVPKNHPRVEACGSVDELNAALGLARATAPDDFARENLSLIQKDLVILMGELAALEEDLPRYRKDGFSVVTPDLTARLDGLIAEIEAQQIAFQGWATPGTTVNSAALDVARTVCRRAERRVCALRETNQLLNRDILVYLNRLSDFLWLLARWVEARGAKNA